MGGRHAFSLFAIMIEKSWNLHDFLSSKIAFRALNTRVQEYLKNSMTMDKDSKFLIFKDLDAHKMTCNDPKMKKL